MPGTNFCIFSCWIKIRECVLPSNPVPELTSFVQLLLQRPNLLPSLATVAGDFNARQGTATARMSIASDLQWPSRCNWCTGVRLEDDTVHIELTNGVLRIFVVVLVIICARSQRCRKELIVRN